MFGKAWRTRTMPYDASVRANSSTTREMEKKKKNSIEGGKGT